MGIFEEDELNRIETARGKWESGRLKDSLESEGELKKEFTTSSGIPISRVYSPLDLKERQHSYVDDVGFPGEYPYTRGITPTMYRGNLPKMMVYAGFGTASSTNERFKYLLAQGAMQLDFALDLPTQIGLDSDNPMSEGEVGKIGVAIDSLADVETLFDGIPLDKTFIGTSANAIGPIVFAFLIAAAEKQGVSPQELRIATQNEPLKEYISRGTYIFPPRPAVKMSCDVVEYAARNKLVDHMWPIWYGGYHFRESGGTAIQEIAFALSDAVEYLEELVKRGVSIDDLPQPRGTFVAGVDLFEEVAKFRALRRMWARMLKERFHATNPRIMTLTFLSGSQASLWTAQQPMNNVIRGAVTAIVEALSGIQVGSIAAMDEALSIPTKESATLALRTLQLICYETGITNTVDPLAGSYYVESLTDELEDRATALFERVQSMGGAVKCIERGLQEKEIAREAYEQYKKTRSGDKPVIGVNMFQADEPAPVQIMNVDPEEENKQVEKLRQLRKDRNNKAVEVALKELKAAAVEGTNLVLPCLKAVKTYATIGEMCDALREVYGEYQRPRY